ncbi:MAG: isoleucine--tRNA ligase [Symbiobacteriaceae bacterium]|nr:isoleucine--tRNA ligase [Symbiobacteriaceae bacterium]
MNLYRQLLEKNRDKPPFLLHDGPPYANGDIHIGHALNKTLKDVVCRFAAMRGYHSPYVPGWDTHGLPIEHAAINRLGLERHQIQPLELRLRCEEFARNQVDRQKEGFRRLGIIGNWDDPYLTLTKEFEGAQMGVFAEFVRQGAVYQGLRPVQWCPHCETALADAEVEYETKHSDSIYVAFEVMEDPRGVLPATPLPIAFAIWTTTPWTLPANMGVCLHKEFRYLAVATANRVFIVAAELKDSFLAATGLQEEGVLAEFVGAELEGIKCCHPFYDRVSLVILGDHVTLEAGTGCVHTSPGHGYEDFMVGKAYGLEILNPTDERGHFTAAAGVYQGLGHEEAGAKIIQDMQESGHLLARSLIAHQYPHCWRCHSPLMFRATEQWFVSVEPFLEQALAEVERVRWYPPSGKLRMSNMLKDRGDWCISRQRAWGVPLPIFYCRECGKELLTYETVKLVQELFAQEGSNIWYTKDARDILPPGTYQCSCGCQEFDKETDIMDVWFDSGSTHVAVLERWQELSWPAAVYLEGTDQYRGWFQSSLWTGVITRGRAPYDQIVVNGFVVDAEGRKMSKHLGNGIEPEEVIKEYGADVLRLWAFGSDFKTADVRISQAMLKQVGDAYRKIRNTIRFLLSNLYDYNPDTMDFSYQELPYLEQVMLSRLHELHHKVTQGFENYEYHQVYHSIYHYCTVDLSAFYLDVSKDRLYASLPDAPERRGAQYLLWQIADHLIRYLVPILNFSSEAMYAHLPVKTGARVAAALLLDWPTPPAAWHNPELLADYDRLITLRDEINKVVEQTRSGKEIGSTLDAQIQLWAEGEDYSFLRQHQDMLAEWLIASQVILYPVETKPSTEAVATSLPSLWVQVKAAPGLKCPRCWTFSEKADLDGLCPRCAQVLQEL